MSKADPQSILIIDDNAEIREVLGMTLKLHGYQIFEAANGEEGLSVLQKKIPSIILLDLMMPVMNGWQFAERLAQDTTFSMIPIIVLSAFDDNTTTINAKAFLKKPFEFTHLLEMINTIIIENEKASC